MPRLRAARLEGAATRRGLRRRLRRIAPVETGKAQLVPHHPDGLDHAVEAQVPQRVGLDRGADLFNGKTGRHELAAAAGVDAVVAGVEDRRRRDADVDFARAGMAEHPYDLPAGGASDDRVVDEDDAAPG